MKNTNLDVDVEDSKQTHDGTVYTAVDLDHWAKMAFWTVSEVACATLGFDPGPIESASLADLQRETVLFDRLAKRAKLVHRAQEAGQLSQRMSPKEAIDWLASIDEECIDGLEEIVSALPIYGDGPLSNLSGVDIDAALAGIDQLAKTTEGQCVARSDATSQTKEISSLRRIMLAAVIGGYGYDPKSRRSPVYGDIVKDAQLAGIDIHVDTVRKHLRLAVDEHWSEPED